MNEARYYTVIDDHSVSCALCPHNCIINNGKSGICGVRRNEDGKLYAASYGKVSSIALDPIEKKPLNMFHPGKMILSVGSFGCNLRCPFCQNSEISLRYAERWNRSENISPEQIATLAKKHAHYGSIGVAYTYNEPLIGYEFVYDCARQIKKAGLSNVLVTNGYINSEPLENLLPHIDAMNIDLKGFTGTFYRKLNGSTAPVMETIALSHRRCHIEVTTLVIPGENDSEEEVSALAKWIASLDPDIPLHLSRFFPRYKYADREPTEKETIIGLRKAARRYLGNVFPIQGG